MRATQFIERPLDITHVRRRFDAVLVFHCADIDNRLAALAARQVPAVLIGHYPGISCVAPDDLGGGHLAAERMLALGHRKMLHLSVGDDLQWAKERANGFEAALAASGVKGVESSMVQGEGSVLGGYRLMRDAWNSGMRPTGVFCATDEMAVGALGALADLGVAVPKEVSILGFDGLTELYPGLASVAQDIPAIAHMAVSLALAAIEKNSIRQKVVPVTLIDGTTLGPAPR